MPPTPNPRGRPRKSIEPQSSVYHFTLTLGNEVYQSEAPTALEALQSLPRPEKIFTKARLLITHGSLKKELLYMPMMCKRIFYPSAQPFIVKNMVLGMK